MKNIINNLIRVANNLDSLGYMEEANIVDRVAKKIVVSANPEVDILSFGQALSIPVTGDYAKDILNYKKLTKSYKQHFDEKTLNNDDQDKFKKIIERFLKKIKNIYDDQHYNAFYNQAMRIRYDIDNNLEDINISLGKDQESLNEFLSLYDIVDYNGQLYDNIKTKSEFNKRWNNFMNDPRVNKIIKRAGDKITKSLSYTYNLLTSKLK